MTDTTTLAADLLYEIECVEDTARKAIGDEWRVKLANGRAYVARAEAQDLHVVAETGDWATACHIARQDPKATLRRCAADRKIVEMYSTALDLVAVTEDTILRGSARVRLGAYERVLRALAEAYDLTDAQED